MEKEILGFSFIDADPRIVEILEGKKIISVRLCSARMRDYGFDSGLYKSGVEGGLTFDLDDGTTFVLGYTELGEWVEWHGKTEDIKEIVED